MKTPDAQPDFLFTCMSLGGQDIIKTDSLSLKRKGGFEERSRIPLSSHSRTLTLRTAMNLVHLLHQSEFLASAEDPGALLTSVSRKDTISRCLVPQQSLKRERVM